MIRKMTNKERNRQMQKEAAVSVALYIAFFMWWYFTGYGIAEKGTPETYTYVFGLPMWFFLSSIVGYLLFCIATVLTVKLVFKNFDLGEEASDSLDAIESTKDSTKEQALNVGEKLPKEEM